jgi:HSP20 family protein
VNQLLDKNTQPSRNDQTSVETSEWLPMVDICEEKEAFYISADIPGVSPKDIEVFMQDGLLHIRGKREEEKRQEEENYIRVERSSGVFYRRFALPETADEDNIEAKSKHGVLEVKIPKRQKSKPKKIEISE